jgi:hypothetical protein
MEHYQGTMLNWSLALGAYALWGGHWAAIAFLAVAVVRLAMEIQRLKRVNLVLAERVDTRSAFFDTGFREPPPRSTARPVAGVASRA